MPHIKLPAGVPGIRGPMTFRPETARPLNLLADALLHQEAKLRRGERELIATFVSALNDCTYCQTIHGAVAAVHLDNEELVAKVKQNYKVAPISDKLKALLTVAAQVQQGGKKVTSGAIEDARRNGADDEEIHDTVLIAAAFCMFNRYVDGLATTLPDDADFYRSRGAMLAKVGYAAATVAPAKVKP